MHVNHAEEGMYIITSIRTRCIMGGRGVKSVQMPWAITISRITVLGVQYWCKN